MTAPAVQIGKGVKWAKLYSNNFYCFYKYAQDVDGNLYSWGRNKALVLGNGLFNIQQADHPNALDVLQPTRVDPLTARYQPYSFKAPSITAGPDQTISGASIQLQGSATPLLLVRTTPTAANGIDTVDYRIVSYRWKKITGGSATIITPDSASTTITGITPGIYVFNLKAADNNTGVLSANVKITVLPPSKSGK